MRVSDCVLGHTHLPHMLMFGDMIIRCCSKKENFGLIQLGTQNNQKRSLFKTTLLSGEISAVKTTAASQQTELKVLSISINQNSYTRSNNTYFYEEISRSSK